VALFMDQMGYFRWPQPADSWAECAPAPAPLASLAGQNNRFCQREAVETIIYLLELALPGRLRATNFQKFQVDAANFNLLLSGQKPTFAQCCNSIPF